MQSPWETPTHMLTASQRQLSALKKIAHPSVLKSQSLPHTVGFNYFDWLISLLPSFFSNFSANLSFEPFMDSPLRGFISSLHQMNQIWEYACEEDWKNSPAEVTLCPIIAPALLYIHQSTVSYLGQLYPKVFRRPQGTRYFGTGPPCSLSLLKTHSLRNGLLYFCPEVNAWSTPYLITNRANNGIALSVLYHAKGKVQGGHWVGERSQVT